MAKLVKHEGNSIDRLSNLPDSIIHHILSLLPTKFAVRTSVLSTRWRFLSTSVSTLDFYDYENPSERFMNFVDRVLLFHNAACIKRFRLICGGFHGDVDAYRICGWISFVLRQCLQELYLEIQIGDPRGMLPLSLFRNKTLTKLELDVSKFVMTIPTKVCLPSLKSLHLDCLEFVDDDSVRRLFSSCPVLEDLFICSCLWRNVKELNISNPSLKRLTLNFFGDCGQLFHVVIDAPNLVYFKFYGTLVERYSFVNLHSLAKVDMRNLVNLEETLVNQDAATNFFNGISNIRSLYCNDDLLWPLSLCNKLVPVFRNLVHVEIRRKCLRQRSGLDELLESSISLKTLVIHNGAFGDLFWYRPEKVPSCLLSHFKVIEIYSFSDGRTFPHCLGLGEVKQMAATFTRGAHTINSIFSKPTIRKNCSKGSSCGDTRREPMKLEAEEVKKNSMGGQHDGSWWVPHDRTGIYYPKGQEKVMADVPAAAGKDAQINWFSHH
ncbi:F-box/LRR-repeat protein At4g14103-like [Herrania umbratica]|uniref:F-box/LRR-repeat protein At4g14103-like n=1 Tax=Herrania umbratica TaxID=108875 RepID=A0A6J1BHC8_9ROSI|nr:F-box/LRR-repeat protein At4g14103-like [Herrania umbratica]